MKNNQIFVTNNIRIFSAVDIVNVYNAHIYDKYYNSHEAEDTRDMHCVLITLEGQGTVVFKDGSKVVVSANNVFFGELKLIKGLSSFVRHWHFLICWFIPLNVNLPDNKVFALKNDTAQIEKIFNAVIELMQTYVESKILHANSIFYCFLTDLLDSIKPNAKKYNKLVQNMLKYINSHIHEPLQIKDLSKEFGYCEKHIRHLFKTALNISPKQYINRAKLENVANLLTGSDIPIQKLTEDFSFNSPTHLCTSFKEKYKMSPREYRIKYTTTKR